MSRISCADRINASDSLSYPAGEADPVYPIRTRLTSKIHMILGYYELDIKLTIITIKR